MLKLIIIFIVLNNASAANSSKTYRQPSGTAFDDKFHLLNFELIFVLISYNGKYKSVC